MKRRLVQRAAVAVATTALAASATAMFGGVAVAGGSGHNHDEVNNTGGAAGGGEAEANCLIPIGLALGIYGSDKQSNEQCTATANGGTGGSAGETSY